FGKVDTNAGKSEGMTRADLGVRPRLFVPSPRRRRNHQPCSTVETATEFSFASPISKGVYKLTKKRSSILLVAVLFLLSSLACSGRLQPNRSSSEGNVEAAPTRTVAVSQES